MLSDKLRELEKAGMIKRKIFAEVPPRVEYSLTELGESIRPVTNIMCKWALTNVLSKGIVY